MLSRQQLELINRKTIKYPLQIAEKDYMLALILQLISQSSLGEKLVFKGGTAIHHCYLPQYRFSEDLDFSTGQQPVTLDDIYAVTNATGFLEIKKSRQSSATIKIERLLYTGPLGHSNSIKLEIDHFQNVLLPARAARYHNVWGFEFKVRVMDIREICAEKIRAMSGRARHRDFYDLFFILEKYKPDLAEIFSFIKQKEIREPVSRERIKKNWELTQTQSGLEKEAVYYSQPVNNRQIQEMIEKIPIQEIDRRDY